MYIEMRTVVNIVYHKLPSGRKGLLDWYGKLENESQEKRACLYIGSRARSRVLRITVGYS